MPYSPTLFIVGYFGFELVGDEAILASMLADFRQRYPNCHFIVTSQNPEKTSADHGVEAIPFGDSIRLISAIRASDVVLVGGGGVFNEYSPCRHADCFSDDQDFNTLCTNIPVLSRFLEKPCMIFAAGVEPLFSESAKAAVRRAFEFADACTVRDEGSRQVLLSTGLSEKCLQVTADPAARLRISQTPDVSDILETSLITPTPDTLLLGISLRHWNIRKWDKSEEANTWEAEVSLALDEFLRSHNGRAIFIPFQKQTLWGEWGDDTRIFWRIREAMTEKHRVIFPDKSLTFTHAARLLAFCNLNLCMRFHSTILSLCAKVPCVSLAYSLKVESAMRRADLERYSVSLDKLTSPLLLHALTSCWNERTSIRQHLAAVSDDWAELALQNVEIASTLIPEQPVDPQNELLRNMKECLALDYLQSRKGIKTRDEAVRPLLRKLVNDNQHLDLVIDILLSICDQGSPDSEFAYLLGFCLHQKGEDPHRAIQAYTFALEHGFSEFWVRYNRGVLYSKLGWNDHARADLIRARELDVTHQGVQIELNALLD